MSDPRSQTPKEIEVPPSVMPPLSAKGYVSYKAYEMGECSIFLGQENIGGIAGVITDDVRWHLSISHPTRFPTWNEIKAARAHLLPDEVHCAMPFPAKGSWLSIHPYCFHLWEVKDFKMTAQWEHDAKMANKLGVNQA